MKSKNHKGYMYETIELYNNYHGKTALANLIFCLLIF